MRLMLTSPEVTGATDPRHPLGRALADIKMKPPNHFPTELPELMSEPPVKFPFVERVHWTLR
jgi:hypothetical protein